MATNYPSSVTRPNDILLGSAKVEYSIDLGVSWVDLDAITGLQITESMTTTKVASDNAPAVLESVKEHYVDVKFNMLALSLPMLKAIRGNYTDTYETTAGTAVAGASQVVANGSWSFGSFIELKGQNASGAQPTITSVTGSVDGALKDPANANCDYVIAKNPAGIWGISIRDGVTATTIAQNITIIYGYTPAATETWATGGLGEIQPIRLRFTALRDISGVMKKFTIIVNKASMNAGIDLSFPAADADQQNVLIPVSFQGQQDADNFLVGKRLMSMTREL